MSEELTLIEQRDVSFYDDTLTAIKANDGSVYAPLRQMCQVLGIDTQGQTQRIRRHTVLSDGERVCKIHTPQGLQSANVLRVDLIPFWLSGIRTKSVKEEIRPKLELLQKQAAKILWDAFQAGQLTTENNIDAIAAIDPEAAEALAIAEAVVKMARSHARLLRQVNSHETRLDAIEAELGDPARIISAAQQMGIVQAVKALAHELGKRSGRNEYQGVYGELYRRFQVGSYKQLPTAQYDEAMNWLRDWYASLFGNAPF